MQSSIPRNNARAIIDVNDRTNIIATGVKSITVGKDVAVYRLDVVRVSVTHQGSHTADYRRFKGRFSKCS